MYGFACKSLRYTTVISFILCAILGCKYSDASHNFTEFTKSLKGDFGAWGEAALLAEKGLPGGLCPESPGICPPSRYRDPTGMCNNVRHPMWGSAGMPFLRILPPNYSDGVSSPVEHAGGGPLPSVNELSRAISNSGSHPYVTEMVGAWGELLQRDMASTFNSGAKCCSSSTEQHEECLPIVGEGGCKDYTRSLPALQDCRYEQREQMNLASSYIDGSDLYGGNAQDISALRLYSGGHVSIENCPRCKEGSPLAALYTVLLHHHNHLANTLHTVNAHWEDERLFQEARRVLIAEIQHITLTEFLPVVLGEESLDFFYLQPAARFFTGYSTKESAGILNEVAVAVLPVFKTMVSPSSSVTNATVLPFALTIENLVGSAAKMPSVDPEDIHRARDHGIPPYHKFWTLCQNLTADSIKLPLVRHLYSDEEYVDLTVGALQERPAPGAAFGPTFGCLFARQMLHTRSGDRFWYENDVPPSSFTKTQLSALRRVSLASVLCNGAPSIQYIQTKAFVQQDPYLNSDIACELHPKLDLSAWKEEPTGQVPDDLVMQAVQRAEADVAARRNEEYNRWSHKGGVDPKSPVGIAAAFNKARVEALNLANTSLLYEYATEELMSSLQKLRRRRRQIFDPSGTDNLLGFPSGGDFSLAPDLTDSLQGVDLTGIIPSPRHIEPECLARDGPEICDETTPFRTHSGYCNNLKKPHLGKSVATFARLLPPAYENGVSKPRLTSTNGLPLPSPRLVSTMIHADISNLHQRYSLMLMQFAQFLDHDITFTPVHRGFFASIPDCRSCDSALTIHPECMPIPIPRGDPHYPQVNQTTGARVCMAFMRSLPGQQQLGPREQINQNSAFIDAAHIYGEHDCQGKDLRSFFGGRLNSTRNPVVGKDLLPQSPNHPECKSPSGQCFIAGDGRASEQPALTSIHTIFMREHNRIAEGLHTINPHWDDELLYQHARRIVTGSWQHMVYNEFLPRLLGWNAVNLYGLKLRPQGYYKGYSDTCNPNVVNEFAAAAFRIGHSLLRPHIPRMSPSYQTLDPPLLLRDGFFNPDIIYKAHMVDEITRGLITTPVETLDQFITGEITNHLFEDRRIPHSGIDLAALNIQRGRDHAIRSYNDYRAVCNLKRAATFEDLGREIPPEVIARLQRIYATVDDIDLFPGGMSERPVAGGLVGPTFACIIAIQFRQLRKCDRFWFETDNPVTKFSEAQLSEIKKITLSKILCENMDHRGDIQRSAFDQPSPFLNPRVPCHLIPDIDLGAWREGAGCHVNGRQLPIGGTAVPTPCTSCVCTAQGAQCASLRITDCDQLLREWSREAVLRDDICTTQCGFLLRDSASQPTGGDPSAITFTTRTPHKGRKLPPIIPDLVPPPPRRRFKIPSFLTK